MAFKLNQKLEKDTIFIKDLEICQLRLMNDMRFFWLILVPRIENAIELHDLPLFQQGQIFNEMMEVSKFISSLGGFDKINIGALGNMVSQLHIHIIGRKKTDCAWPSPVWGNGAAIAYENSAELIEKIKIAF